MPIVLKVSARARSLRLRVDPRTGQVLLTVPRRVSQRRALKWAAEHQGWIAAQLARIVPPSALEPGAAIPLHGVDHVIDWSATRPRRVVIEDGRLVVGGPRDGLEPRLLRWLKRHAAETLVAETREFAAKAEVTVSRVGVGDTRSRWGSCSASGGIRYSWRLILAPDWVRRATVAHEVAHRVHMNHGPDFHALVETLLGADPKPARLWLRRHGAGLHRIAAAA
ncbi:MAG: family peptidase [Alphaproteobacteria bacterium]|nr:family peptidase [Alphaproteobacteria bacterium]